MKNYLLTIVFFSLAVAAFGQCDRLEEGEEKPKTMQTENINRWITGLQIELKHFCKDNNLPVDMSADEILIVYAEKLTPTQKEYLEKFCEVWEMIIN